MSSAACPSCTTPATCPSTLEELLAPHDPAGFLARDWGRRFRWFDGPAQRFEGLMPWPALNDILASVHFEDGRLFLSQQGKNQPASAWQKPSSRIHRWDPNVDAPRLEAALGNGATLVINSVDPSYAPLDALCTNLETIFRTEVCANLYAAWRVDTGLDLHWDPQDLLIVQVHGKKRWTVWEPTVPHPRGRRHLAPEHRPGDQQVPVFDRVLEAGQMLHIPRGFWHLPCAVDEPSLHLTLTMVPRTGTDLLQWVVKQAQDSVAARMNVPVFATPDERRVWLAALRDQLVSAFDDDVLERFLADLDGNAAVAPRPIRLRTAADGRLAFEVDGNEWKTTPSARPLFEKLADGRPHALRDLISDDCDAVLDCVDALVADRILQVVSR